MFVLCLSLNCIAQWLWQDHIVEMGGAPEGRRLPVAPPFRDYCFHVFGSGVVRIQDEIFCLSTALIKIHSKNGMSQHVTTNHHRAAYSIKMVGEFPDPFHDFCSRIRRDKSRFDSKKGVEDEADFGTTDPFSTSDKVILFVSNVHKTLLNLSMRRNRLVSISIQNEPTPNSLEASVGAAPSIIVDPILHIMMVTVGSLHQRYCTHLFVVRNVQVWWSQ